MTITARYASTCTACGLPIAVGSQIEWERGNKAVRHTDCAATPCTTTTPASRTITVERVGRRSYLRGDTLAVRGLLRDGGCHWDAEQRAWWIGDDTTAQQVAAEARTAPAEAAPRKRITRCVKCGDPLDDWRQRRGIPVCPDCSHGGSRYMGGMSYRDRDGHFVLGDDD